jgi:hypothetical protein
MISDCSRQLASVKEFRWSEPEILFNGVMRCCALPQKVKLQIVSRSATERTCLRCASCRQRVMGIEWLARSGLLSG